jgi:hypothetical protein
MPDANAPAEITISATAPDAPPPRKSLMRFVVTKGSFKRMAILLVLIVLAIIVLAWLVVWMPGTSFKGELPAATPSEIETAGRLRNDVEAIAGSIGVRSTYNARQLAQTALSLKTSLESMGHAVLDHSFPARGAASPNLQIEIQGTDPALANEIILVGAHYDSYHGTPGADDNASGVAAVLELARRANSWKLPRTVRLVLFVNEEPPAFMTADMGSLIYAKKARQDGDNIVAMLSLECIGYFNTKENSQEYPWPLGYFYPTTGDFIAIVGNLGSRGLVHRTVASFRSQAQFPCEGAAAPDRIPGIGWSDHWSFWQHGYKGVMVTGTAPFRNANYHEASDTPGTLDYDRMSRVVEGIEKVVIDLATNGA